MAKYIVTGATSFIGRTVVEELLKKKHEVYVIIRPTSTKKKMFEGIPGCYSIYLDLENIEQCTNQLKDADYFMHFAWDGIAAKGRSNPTIQAQNVNLTRKCLKMAANLGCKKFLFAGSQAEYGIKNEVISEDTDCSPVIEYGKGKLRVLEIVRPLAKELGITYYHARIFSVYGSGDHPWTLVSSSIEKFRNGEEFKASSGEQLWNYMYIDDAANVMIALMESNAGSGVYNIASNDTRPLKDFIREIYKCCGEKGTLSLGAYTPIERPNNLQPDITKLTNAIGTVKFVRFSDGINKMIAEQEVQKR